MVIPRAGRRLAWSALIAVCLTSPAGALSGPVVPPETGALPITAAAASDSRSSGGAAALLENLGDRAGRDAAALGADWLMRQAELDVARMTGLMPQDARDWQSEVGGTGTNSIKKHGKYDAPFVPMLMSLVLPGAGEAYLGHKRGFFLMALDIASWYGVAHNADQGRRKRDDYYAFADVHWSLEKLDAAYDRTYLDRPDADFDLSQIVGVGSDYFTDVNHYTQLPLWVSEAADRREYYENLGKWDQFVFGWDDFVDPRFFLEVTETDIANLKDPRTSANREIYRQMRRDSNAAYTRRDRFLYMSLGLRVFSVLQVAYLEGLLFGNDKSDRRDQPRQLAIGGHRIDLIVEPVGLSRGVFGASVSF